jgi:hypothetical protein
MKEKQFENNELEKSNRFSRYRVLIAEYLRNFNSCFKSSDLNLSDFERIESKKQSYKTTHNPWRIFNV